MLRDRGNTGDVSSWFPADSHETPFAQTSLVAPYGLRLRQTIQASGAVTIPAGINFVYAIVVGAGGAGATTGEGGGAGGLSWGWTPTVSTCIVGAGVAGFAGGYSRYGLIVAGGGMHDGSSLTGVGAGGAGGNSTQAGRNGQTNIWGMPQGASHSAIPSTTNGQPGKIGSGAGGGNSTTLAGGNGGKGGTGISGGGGGAAAGSGSSAQTGGAGGDGMIGGGGGAALTTTGTRTGGAGGNGIGIDGTVYTGGTGSSGTNTNGAGGGGAGIAANGANASGTTGGAGGLGGGGGGAGGSAGGKGGDGIIYLYY